MIAYLDTSALVKEYFREAGSEIVEKLFEEAERIHTSIIGYAEAVSAFNRKRREGATASSAFAELFVAFKADWQQLYISPLTADINDRVELVVAKHPLRAFDAIHLASALAVRSAVSDRLQFVSGDHRLIQAAQSEGLSVLAV